MTIAPVPNWSVFRVLCRVLGGQDPSALTECINTGQFQPLFDMARMQDLLPALAVRCNELSANSQVLSEPVAGLLKQALMDNTRRNMHISAQAIKITRRLNEAGITPLFLKGTAHLLTGEARTLGFRKQMDIDLVVQPRELQAAGDIFLADGYRFSRISDHTRTEPLNPGDTAHAIKSSYAHHHLPPLEKAGYVATVELHRHFLPRRFQPENPLEALFSRAREIERHHAVFKVPCVEHQLIHLILGNVVHDGHLARRDFPIREACDYIALVSRVEGMLDHGLVSQRCGKDYATFSRLVSELMGYTPPEPFGKAIDITHRLQLMQKRYNLPGVAKMLDTHARVSHLAWSMLSNPLKLPAYLRRLVGLV